MTVENSDTDQAKNFQLSFAGGGANFLAHLEVIATLQSRFRDKINITRVSGTSAGAIAAAVVALDLDADCVKQTIKNKEEAFVRLFSFQQSLSTFQEEAKPIWSVLQILAYFAIVFFLIFLAVAFVWEPLFVVGSLVEPFVSEALLTLVLWLVLILPLAYGMYFEDLTAYEHIRTEGQDFVADVLAWEAYGLDATKTVLLGLTVLFLLLIARRSVRFLYKECRRYFIAKFGIVSPNEAHDAFPPTAFWRNPFRFTWRKIRLGYLRVETTVGRAALTLVSILFLPVARTRLYQYFDEITSRQIGGKLQSVITEVLEEAYIETQRKRTGVPFRCRDLLVLATDLNTGLAAERSFKRDELDSMLGSAGSSQLKELVDAIVISSGIPFVFRSLRSAFNNTPVFSDDNIEDVGFFVDGGFAENLPADSVINTQIRDTLYTDDYDSDLGGIVLVELRSEFKRLNTRLKSGNEEEYRDYLNRLFLGSIVAMLKSLFLAQTSLVDHLAYVSGQVLIDPDHLVDPLDFEAAFEKFIVGDTSKLRGNIEEQLDSIHEDGRQPNTSPLREVHYIDITGSNYGWSNGLFSRSAKDRNIQNWMNKIGATYSQISRHQQLKLGSRAIRVEIRQNERRNLTLVEILTKTTLELIDSADAPNTVNAMNFCVVEDYSPLPTLACQVELIDIEQDPAKSIFFPSGSGPHFPVSREETDAKYLEGIIVNFEDQPRTESKIDTQHRDGSEAKSKVVKKFSVITRQVLGDSNSLLRRRNPRTVRFKFRLRNEFDQNQNLSHPYFEKVLIELIKNKDASENGWELQAKKQDQNVQVSYVQSAVKGAPLTFGTRRSKDAENRDVFEIDPTELPIGSWLDLTIESKSDQKIPE